MKPDIRPDVKKVGYTASRISGTTLIFTDPMAKSTLCSLFFVQIYQLIQFKIFIKKYLREKEKLIVKT